jgi:Flp pilus assembly protein TadG
MKFLRLTSNKRRASRQGVAAAELAVCLPVIVLIVLATIEACTMVFLKQSLSIAAYEGARAALMQNATNATVQNAANQVLTQRRVNGGTITLRPGNLLAVVPGEYMTVTCSAPASRNSIIPIRFYRGRTLTGSATMMKEFESPIP